MKIKELEQQLRAKEKQLWTEMSRTEAEGRALAGPDLQDREDDLESKEEVFQESTLEWQQYQQVRAALERMEAGTYGKCVECGKQIAPERLHSVPWTPYCLKHQKQHDPAAAPFSL